MSIFLELIPKEGPEILAELQQIKKHYPQINGLNFPDLLKYPVRSWDCAIQGHSLYQRVIPHIRAIDFDISKPLLAIDRIYEAGLREVLVLTGDPPQEMRRIYPNRSIDLIRQIKSIYPDMKVYAGIDQYRLGMSQELSYVDRKEYAGADGFFTQPFFDLRLLEIWQEQLQGKQIFWGISPVTSERSYWYWVTKNHTVFPADFEANLEWNIKLARQVLSFAEQNATSVYIMPIRTNLERYLTSIFEGDKNETF
jgi:methylenetetrahydrofolate reductase (NADPH)